MTQGIGSNPTINTLPVAQEKPCYAELFECIQAIWNKFCTWICEWVGWLTSFPEYNLAKRNQNCYCHVVRYLEPEDVARCERVAKSWKTDRIWQAQCANYGITVAPQGGVFKDRFKVPEMAFGPREWREHFGKVGPMPPLPVNIKSQIEKLKTTHTLTLIPKTVNGQPLSFNSFAPLAEKAGMKLSISPDVLDKFGNEAVDKALWVWVEQKVKEGSRGKTQAQAEHDYPVQLGKALYYTISTVAHYARYKICLLPQIPRWTYARTCDGGKGQYGAWFVVVGGSAPGVLCVDGDDYALGNYCVASLVPAHSV